MQKFHKLKTWSADILGPSHAEVHNIITSSLRLMAHRLKRNPEASQYPAKHEHGTSSPQRSGLLPAVGDKKAGRYGPTTQRMLSEPIVKQIYALDTTKFILKYP